MNFWIGLLYYLGVTAYTLKLDSSSYLAMWVWAELLSLYDGDFVVVGLVFLHMSLSDKTKSDRNIERLKFITLLIADSMVLGKTRLFPILCLLVQIVDIPIDTENAAILTLSGIQAASSLLFWSSIGFNKITYIILSFLLTLLERNISTNDDTDTILKITRLCITGLVV